MFSPDNRASVSDLRTYDFPGNFNNTAFTATQVLNQLLHDTELDMVDSNRSAGPFSKQCIASRLQVLAY